MARRMNVEYVNCYVAGSAALAFDPAPKQQKKATLPKPRRLKKIRLYVDPVTVACGVLAAILLVMVICGCVELNGVKQQQAQMQEYVDRLQMENAQLQEQYEAGYDPDEIYQIAIGMGMIPADQAPHLSVQVQVPQSQEQLSGWESFIMFLSGLFA